MKRNLYALCVMLTTISCLQANVLSDTWDKTKDTAQSAYNKAQRGWDSLGDDTKKSIKTGLKTAGAVAGAAALSGAAYYGYNQYNESNSEKPNMYTRPNPDKFQQDESDEGQRFIPKGDRDADYATLGLSQNASKAEIKQSYHRLAKQYHPDKGGDDEMFKKIQGAYLNLTSDE